MARAGRVGLVREALGIAAYHVEKYDEAPNLRPTRRQVGRSLFTYTGYVADGYYIDQADIAQAWQRIRGRVRDWNDLEPALIGRVEELIDFVTAPAE